MTSLDDLKETKLPRYIKGTSSANYKVKVLAAASSRSRAEDAFEGVILRELMAAEAAQDPNDPGFLTPDEIEERERENKKSL